MRTWFVTGLLVSLGCLQMAGDLLGNDTLKGLAAATGASPTPKVFTAHDGFETFSSEFFIDYIDTDGTPLTLELTPAVYRGLRGPYNRRNAYGAVLAYGPLLANNPRTARMFSSVSQYAFCNQAPIRNELGLGPDDTAIVVRIVSRGPQSLDDNRPMTFEVNCHE